MNEQYCLLCVMVHNACWGVVLKLCFLLIEKRKTVRGVVCWCFFVCVLVCDICWCVIPVCLWYYGGGE